MSRLGRLGPLTPVAVALALAVSFLGSCTDHEPEDAVEAVGSETITIRTADGLTLDGRVWDRGHDRLVIYLHEFRENQDSWWPYAREPRGEGVSALTFDFRGHGKSEGNLDDIDGMVLDAEAAIAFARDRGFERVMLVGAGMGAAVGLVAAADVPDVTIVGFSTPADFDTLDTVDVVERLDGRVQLIATRDDVSAADSLHKFRALGNVDSTEARLYPGGGHGVDLLSEHATHSISERFDELLADFWVPHTP